ncbi:hypothetical protein [Oricola sp.]|uniref:hypothetical protein n=1 Tax=Oricola sp. TaxID=1979950 RepID=UPI0025EB008D|nr:hypothetical protein [Oricola sp.]MCI5074849.1 hypothetical protein [Oricola sp.]
MQKLSPQEARQGERGRPVLYVLIAGLALAGVAALFLHPYQQDAGTLDQTPIAAESEATTG